MKQLSTFLLFFLAFNALQAQTSKDATVPLSASFTVGPASVTLNWPNPGNANLLVRRRTKGQGGTAWQQILNMSGSNLTTVTDNNLTAGQIYEYSILRTINNINAYGYAHVALNANPVDSRGKILIFVDSTNADALGVELVRMKNDMRGDGWWPIAFHTGPSSTVQSIKDQIITSYNEDPMNVKAVLLIGNIPVPYSGNNAWDGHTPDHTGAWPCDAYYGDINGTWTDATINNAVPNRDANDNIPGDGKFDQSILPSPVELQVGRVDFSNMDAAAFGEANQIGLMKRYLDKNHRWRIGEYTVEQKALVDDNFGYFGGEAFAANGFRNAYPLVGEANIVETDFFEGTEAQSYLLGYGCGGGNYNGAGGVGSSSNFATDSVNIVFSNLFGSYFGDWDYEVNPFMPSALASRGGILTCSWAGRPHWFNQALASGETIGYCAKETMNAGFNSAYSSPFGEGGAHTALLGDPTLRAHILKPASNLSLTNLNCQSVELNWTASPDSVSGYHVYRAPSQDGPYTRLTGSLITATTYTDPNPAPGTVFYQVRAIQNVSSPGGGTYANNSVGLIKFIELPSPPAVNPTVIGHPFNCNNQPVQVFSGNNDPTASFFWTGPNNFSSTLSDPFVSSPGTYLVVVTVGACTVIGGVEVVPATIINLSTVVTNESIPDANDGAINLSFVDGIGPFSYLWSNGATSEDLVGLGGGTYTVTVTDLATGCSSVLSSYVSTTSGIEESALFEQFLISPNPSTGLSTLTLKPRQAANLRVEIRDMTGRLVLGNPVQTTELLVLPMDLTQSPAGQYLVMVWIDNQLIVQHLNIVR